MHINGILGFDLITIVKVAMRFMPKFHLTILFRLLFSIPLEICDIFVYMYKAFPLLLRHSNFLFFIIFYLVFSYTMLLNLCSSWYIAQSSKDSNPDKESFWNVFFMPDNALFKSSGPSLHAQPAPELYCVNLILFGML